MVDYEQQLGKENSASELLVGIGLSQKIAEIVRPVYGIRETGVETNKISQDYNYLVDVRAEQTIKGVFHALWQRGIYLGYVTEDQGIVLPTTKEGQEVAPKWICMIDPVDGSRPAQSGFEMASVTLVGVPGDKREATFSDIEFGVTHAIKENRTFFARKGRGVYELIDGKIKSIQNPNRDLKLSDCSAVIETYSMSNELLGIVIDPLVRRISYKQEFTSGSYSDLAVVLGRHDIHLDLSRAIAEGYPGVEVALKGTAKSLYPMDIAAGWLMIQELGGIVTDAHGNSLANNKLWAFKPDGSWSAESQISYISALNPQIHQETLSLVKEGFEALDRKTKNFIPR